MIGEAAAAGVRFAGTALLLAVNTAVDIRRKEVLPAFSCAVGAAGVILRCGSLGDSLPDILFSFVPGVIFLLLSLAGRGGIGMGDGIVTAAAGGWLPASDIFTAVSFSLVFAVGASIPFLLAGKRKKQLPYIPFLLLGFLFGRIIC